MLESAKFEEKHTHIEQARKIYEQLDLEMAPGLVQVALARINFEERQRNIDKDKVCELYEKSF